MKYIFVFILILESFPSFANCEKLKAKAYEYQECQGKNAFQKKNYTLAIKHFKGALKIDKYESPNYNLKMELGESLCLLGKKEEGAKELQDYLCMSALDLNFAKCETSSLKEHCPHMTIDDCETVTNFMGNLNKKFIKSVKQKRKAALKKLKICQANLSV